MDLELVKKVSFALLIIGIVTITTNSIVFLVIRNNLFVNYLTFIGITISTIVMYIGVRHPSKKIAYYQIIGTYVLVFFCFLDDPGNIAGIVLGIINYILFAEYRVIRKVWMKCAVIMSYSIPIILSIVIFEKSFKDLPPTYLVIAFFCFFLYTFIHHKKEKSLDAVEKSIKVIAELEPITVELIGISKRQGVLIEYQARQIEEYNHTTVVS